jgi:hypothetical protein
VAWFWEIPSINILQLNFLPELAAELILVQPLLSLKRGFLLEIAQHFVFHWCYFLKIGRFNMQTSEDKIRFEDSIDEDSSLSSELEESSEPSVSKNGKPLHLLTDLPIPKVAHTLKPGTFHPAKKAKSSPKPKLANEKKSRKAREDASADGSGKNILSYFKRKKLAKKEAPSNENASSSPEKKSKKNPKPNVDTPDEPIPVLKKPEAIKKIKESLYIPPEGPKNGIHLFPLASFQDNVDPGQSLFVSIDIFKLLYAHEFFFRHGNEFLDISSTVINPNFLTLGTVCTFQVRDCSIFMYLTSFKLSYSSFATYEHQREQSTNPVHNV